MEELLNLLSDLFPDIDFETEDALVDDGLLDTDDMESIASEVEDRLGVVIPGEELTAENFNSAEDLYELIQTLDE